MNREGHVGVALAGYAPIGFVTINAGYQELAYLGAGVVATLAMVPDIDIRIPLVAHRGFTHTVWFALAVGAACGILSSSVSHLDGRVGSPWSTAFGAAVGATAVLSHVAADAITPMGVRPFAPFGERYSVGLVRSSNRIANLFLLALGVSVFAGGIVLGVKLA